MKNQLARWWEIICVGQKRADHLEVKTHPSQGPCSVCWGWFWKIAGFDQPYEPIHPFLQSMERKHRGHRE
jgi:hypothetical protein